MKFTVYIEPVAKARARTVVHHGKVHSFTPRKTEKAEWAIRQAFLGFYSFRPPITDAPVKIEATFFLSRPKTLPKRKTMPVTRPDWDNYGKLVADALNRYAYVDDSNITTAIIKKRYGSPPRIDIEITEDLGEE